MNVNWLPLGDQAILGYFPDEAAALRFAGAIRRAAPGWVVDVVHAYASVAIYFDLLRQDFAGATAELETVAREADASPPAPGRLCHIPCCYEFGPDLGRIAEHTRLTVDKVIRLHTGTVYTVYAIGFCPGFPYLGYLPPALT